MAEVIRMPRMSDTMEEGVIVGWLKQVGDTIEPGDVLAEVETDKATMELESFHEGVLLHIGVKEGPVPVNGVLAVIGEAGEDFQAALAAAGSNDVTTTSSSPTETANEPEVEEVFEHTPNHTNSDKRIKASPLAKSMAATSGLDLSTIQGSGDNGRIIKRDIEARLQGNSTPAPVTTPSVQPTVSAPVAVTPPKKETASPAIQAFRFSTEDDSYEDTPVSQMRKVIARRLGESKFSAPHFYLTIEINMDKAIETRKKVNEVAPTRISYNDFVVKASAVALQQHPAINSSWLGDKIRTNHNINIGVAVAVDEGLLVPVIRHANMKTLSQINSEVRTLAGKAKERKLQPDQMSGNTFTISNLGMFGIEEFTAIINPPDACILAVGGIIEKPIVKDGEVVPGNMMKVTLSCDHRVVDGATGAKFLNTLKDLLEDPIRMIV